MKLAVVCLVIVIVLVVGVMSCDVQDKPVKDIEGIEVATSTVVLKDFVENLVGDAILVHSIVPHGADVHTYRLKPRSIARLRSSSVIFMNGHGIDDSFMHDVQDAFGSERRIINLSDRAGLTTAEDLPPFTDAKSGRCEQYKEEDVGGEHHDQIRDPHYWMNPRIAIVYVQIMRDALIREFPLHGGDISTNADRYIAKLRDLDSEIENILTIVPKEQRVLVTFHNAFANFGLRYGFDIIPFVDAHGGDATPGRVSRVINLAQCLGLKAIFEEENFDSPVLKAAAFEAGVNVATVHLTFGARATNYIEMLLTNARTIGKELR